MSKPLLDRALIDPELHDAVNVLLVQSQERGTNPVFVFGTMVSLTVHSAVASGASMVEIWDTARLCWKSLKDSK